MSFIAIIITTVYQFLSLLEITPKISENELSQYVSIALNILVSLGVIINPTTQGISDKEENDG